MLTCAEIIDDWNCFTANSRYAIQQLEGWVVSTTTAKDFSVVLHGVRYATVPITLYFTDVWKDNFVTVNSSSQVPKEYASEGQVRAQGRVLATQAPGSVPLQVWYKQYSATHQDYATVASDAGVAWAKANGYTYQSWSSGYVLTAPPVW